MYPVRVQRAFRYRFHPTPVQEQMLARTFGCIRVVWNRTLKERHRAYHTEGRTVGYAETDRNLTTMKKDPGLEWLTEVSSVPLQQALRHQHTAFQAFFAKRARYPRFKSRRGRQSATYTRSAFSWRDGQLKLAKMTEPLAIVWSRPLPDGVVPSSVTVSRDCAGRWHVSMLVEDPLIQPLPPTRQAVGVDLGLKDFAVLSTGEHIPHPRHYQRKEQRLARYQRQMARKRKGSANRAKARVKVARAHARVVDARRDFLHKTSTDLVRRFDVIAVEDLNVSGMVRNHSLAKSIATSGWAEFRGMLEYKATWYGRTVAAVDRWYPSSKTCSACGHLLANLSLGTRHWTCPACGARHDRDVNAAKNIVAAGRAVAREGEACGAGVSHGGQPSVRPAMKQEPLAVRPRIPVL
jgi:putative transposase